MKAVEGKRHLVQLDRETPGKRTLTARPLSRRSQRKPA
jgi:hypothetical protein